MQNLHTEILTISLHLEASPTGMPQELMLLLFFPNFSTFGNKSATLLKNSKKIAKDIVHNHELDIHGQIALPEEVDLAKIHFSVGEKKFTSPPVCELSLPYITWHQDGHLMAFLPSLGIEVFTSLEKLDDDLRSSIGFHLKKTGTAKDLMKLALLQRKSDITIERHSWNAGPLTTKEYYRANYESHEKQVKVLKQVASRMFVATVSPAYQRDSEVSSLYANFSSKRPSSLLLIGSSGCGKTAIIHELIRIHHASIGNFWESSGSRLIAGQTGYGMWQQRCRDLIEEVKGEPIVLYLGNLYELMQVGQSNSSSESIASYLRPYISRGDILVVVECTKEQYSAIELNAPQLLDALKSFPIEEPSRDKALVIIDELIKETDEQLSLPTDSSRTIISLHQRFARYSALPGKAITFTQSLIDKSPEKPYTTRDIIQKFSDESGLPMAILDDTEDFSPEKVSTWFEEHVMAQPQAVAKLVSMLTAVKSRLSAPNKPLGSFMFIGPTGVGKTELAKTLALYLYGDKNRIVRFDMSEYNSVHSAQRLVSNSFSEKEGLLTAAVREQPFSIILLDEFEKAATEVYDLFLQVLGEGRLTDGAGRLADFSNAIIIMTSNLGAANFNQGQIGFGDSSGQISTAEDHFTEAVRKEVRPEFFNRIDSIVPFLPLTLESVKRIAEREIRSLLVRDGFHYSNLSFEISPTLLNEIIEDSYNIKYGVRPLKRALEQSIMLPLAKYLDQHVVKDNSKFIITKPDQQVKISVTFENLASKNSQASEKRLLNDSIVSLGSQRLLLHKLVYSSMISELSSEINRIKQKITWEKKKAAKQLSRTNINRRKINLDGVYIHFDPVEQARHDALETLVADIKNTSSRVANQEEQALLSLYNNEERVIVENMQEEIETLILRSFSLHKALPSKISITFLTDDFGWMNKLIDIYSSILEKLDAKFTLGLIHRNPEKKYRYEKTTDLGTSIALQEPEKISYEDYKSKLAKNAGQLKKSLKMLAIEIDSSEAALLLRNESGLHSYEFEEKRTHRCRLTVHQESLSDMEFPIEEKEVPVSLKTIAVRRQFTLPYQYYDSYTASRGEGAPSELLVDSLLRKTLMMDATLMLD